MTILDVGGAGDCNFFRVVSHQLHGELSFHMNIRSTGAQYMRHNLVKFIENRADHSWLRYLVYMSHQGTLADKLVTQAVADALNLTIHIIYMSGFMKTVSRLNQVVFIFIVYF